jgi:hypothetical protein
MKSDSLTIQLLFDELEVLRIENGKKFYEQLVPANISPRLIHMKWNGEVVYTISPQTGEIQVNRLRSCEWIDDKI